MALPIALYCAEQVQVLDQYISHHYKISGRVLMERAGHAVFEALLQRWPSVRCIVVVCGIGNNAGDGYVVARLAKLTGHKVQVLQVGDVSRLSGDALAAANAWRDYGGEIKPFAPERLTGAEVVVDALLGTGLNRPVEGEWYAAIAAMNQHPACISIDIPSGLQADTGAVLGIAVTAEVTVTFIGLKQGLLTGAGVDYCGTLVFDSLQVPEAVYESVKPAAYRLDQMSVVSDLPPRSRASHKGCYGHVLVVGGDYGYPGAVRLAAEAAARAGAGLVTVATRPVHIAAVVATRPELICFGLDSPTDIRPFLNPEQVAVVVIGPGLGQSAWGQGLLQQVLTNWSGPMIIDADGLNGLAAFQPEPYPEWILTPHPGEAGRLLNQATAAVQADRFTAVRQLQRRYGGVAVLKGAGSLVQALDSAGEPVTWLCDQGNPGMASGGMGDVLAGLIGGLRAQGLSAVQSACLGVYLHAQAGDIAAREAGERGLLASDLWLPLRQLLNPRNPARNAGIASLDSYP